MGTVHHLLASISLGIILTNQEKFSLHDSIFMLNILTRDQGGKKNQPELTKEGPLLDKDEAQPFCSFDQFKLILLSLFGVQIFELTEIQIDRILR